MAVPVIAQATGLPQVSRSRSSLEKRNTASNTSATGFERIAGMPRSMSLRSAPARNKVFAEVMTAPLSVASDFRRPMQASRSSRNTSSMVFADLVGWSIVQTTMSWSMSWRITVVMVASLTSAR